MLHFWDDKEKTDESIIDGWMLTGDLAIIDEDGFCDIVGRVKDMIIRGGENISPVKIENDLIKIDFIEQALVYGDNKPFLVALLVLIEEKKSTVFFSTDTFLSTHYRKPINFGESLLEQSKNILNKLYKNTENKVHGDKISEDVINPLLDDLNTPLAISNLLKIKCSKTLSKSAGLLICFSQVLFIFIYTILVLL